MRSLTVVANECLNELKRINIPYGKIEKFTVNTRAKCRWGMCRRLPNGTYQIQIAEILLKDETPIESLKTTIIHEILHTCKGCMNHGAAWKNYAGKVNNYYGYNVKRCNSTSEMGIPARSMERKVKHQFRCNHCGQTVNRSRESNFTKYYKEYKCGICNGKFEKIF